MGKRVRDPVSSEQTSALSTRISAPMALMRHLEARLRQGEHLTLFGPRGSGKSTLLRALELRLSRAGVPCAYSPSTDHLDDITRALEQAYPAVATATISRRAARARLWQAADASPGVLLLDAFANVSNAMVTLLRRLHGGVAGVLVAVDVDSERERRRLRAWRYGSMRVCMPRTPARNLRRLLQGRCQELSLPLPDKVTERMLLRAARGRPGWILECTALEREARYWRDSRLLVNVLCTDTEATVRLCARPWADRTPSSRH